MATTMPLTMTSDPNRSVLGGAKCPLLYLVCQADSERKVFEVFDESETSVGPDWLAEKALYCALARADDWNSVSRLLFFLTALDLGASEV